VEGPTGATGAAAIRTAEAGGLLLAVPVPGRRRAADGLAAFTVDLPVRPIGRDFATLEVEEEAFAAEGRAGFDARADAFLAGFFGPAAGRAERDLLGILGG
jgi:hypothetical protein